MENSLLRLSAKILTVRYHSIKIFYLNFLFNLYWNETSNVACAYTLSRFFPHETELDKFSRVLCT